MIVYLDALNPSENWGQFLNADDAIKWELISLAGYSQGATHTLYISKRMPLLRASFLSGPNGFIFENGSFPGWISNEGATPNSALYGFSNSGDDLYTWELAKAVWEAIGIPGTEANVDGNSDFGGSHRLFTEVVPLDTQGWVSTTHSSTAVDIVNPVKEHGRPFFENIWRFTAFPA